MPKTQRPAIRIHGARQNNLKNLSLELPLHELIVITGVSGSGKSSLAFDTLYAEGQRRYVETFSPYARQFLDRMDRPQVDRVEDIPPAIAIDQTNPVRTSRSTVGTMTEINDHLKLLFARAAQLHCRQCGKPVRRDTPASITASLHEHATAAGDPRLLVCFEVARPKNLPEKELRTLLEAQGYVRILEEPGRKDLERLTVIQDRLRLGAADAGRVGEALEAALKGGRGRIVVHALDDAGGTAASWRYSAGLHCAECDIAYQDPLPSHFSFNSPLGACDTCRGFGRVIGVDYDLVIPDKSKTLGEGAIKPWQTATGKECQIDMERHAPAAGIPMDVPWNELTTEQQHWVIQGDGRKGRRHWYGAKGYFDWLESKAYKMHVRVLLSRYRSYNECPACHGARLKPESLLWRLGPYNMQQLVQLPVARCRAFFEELTLPPPLSDADTLVLSEIRARLGYLCEVGLSYLTLDRQSRTLSGGEVQRINLTTALGTSLVNTLFVLDEPSIGLHPRDMGRVIGVMQKLRDAGNSLVVVEHDPQIMFEADRLIDMGPGAGEHGGEILYNGAPPGVLDQDRSLTGAYLSGRRRISAGGGDGVTASMAGALVLEGASLHNVHGATLTVPLGQLVCVTGVSGSGKSTLVTELLYPRVAARVRQTQRTCRPVPAPHRPRPAGQRGTGGSVADRPHHALLSGQLRGRLRPHPQPVREAARGRPAQVHAGYLQLQLRQRTLPGVRRQRLRACGDAVAGGRVSALPGVQRPPLPRGDPGAHHRRRRRAARGYRRGAGHDRQRGRGILRRRCRSADAAEAAGRGGAFLCTPGPAGAHAVRRRGAAPETGRPSGRYGQCHAPVADLR